MNRYFKFIAITLFALVLSISLSAQRNKDVDDALNDKSKVSGLHVGSYVGFGYANGWQLEFAPGVGYRVFDFLIVEAGVNYSYTEQFFSNASNDKQYATLFGPRVGIKGNIYGQFYGLAEYQLQSFRLKQRVNGTVTTFEKSSENLMYLGAGYTNNFGQGVGFYTDFVFDVLYDRVTSPRSTPYSIRFGVFYTFP